MLVPHSWLRDFAPFTLSAVELGTVFDELGMVVEGIEAVGDGLGGVVVGRVLEVSAIAGARVRRTRVDLGPVHGRDVEIVCGAPNVEAGQLVPVAVVGATLPGRFEIAKRKVMGIVSNGMICSERELALSGEGAGILVLPDGVGDPGDAFATAMGIERDDVFDLAIETNRPDANCVVGVARDAAARLGLPFAPPSATSADGVAIRALLDAPPAAAPAVVSDDALALAPRVGVAILDGCRIGPSPDWMAKRLLAAGMRPISNLVDISNYVMLELGQPTHPYDLDRLPGGGLSVRLAMAGETITTLDDAERIVGDGRAPDVLICDAVGTPVGIAGIMGGATSEVHEGTTRVLLEAAHFDRLTIAKTSKRLGLRSEASRRFERGVDPLGIEGAAARFIELAAEIAGATLVAWSVTESPADIPVRRPITLRTSAVNALLGTDLDAPRIDALLRPIGHTIDRVDAQTATVTPPSFRLDCDLEADLIEEVARHHGYASIPRTMPRSPLTGALSDRQRQRRLVREVLCGLGCTEAQGGLLIGPGDHDRAGLDETPGSVIVATDPMAKEESVLRRSLRPGLLKAIGFNLDRRADVVRLFEVGHTFTPTTKPTKPARHSPSEAALPDEAEVLTVLLAGGGTDASAAVAVWSTLAAALRLDGAHLEAPSEPERVVRALADGPIVERGLHPTRLAHVLSGDGSRLGLVGEVDPDVVAAWGIAGRVAVLEVDLDRILAAPRRDDVAPDISRFPSADIDLAFAVPDAVPAALIEASVRSAAGPLLAALHLFDVYRGAGMEAGVRSLAYALRFSSTERTLTDGEVGAARQACIDAVVAAHQGATLR